MASFRVSNTEVKDLQASLNHIGLEAFAEATFKLYQKKVLGLLPIPVFGIISSPSRLPQLQDSVDAVAEMIKIYPVTLEDTTSHANLEGQITGFRTALDKLNDINRGTYHKSEGIRPSSLDKGRLEDGLVERLKTSLNHIHCDVFAQTTFELYEEKVLGLWPSSFETRCSRLYALQESVNNVAKQIEKHPVSLDDTTSHANLEGQIAIFRAALEELNNIQAETYRGSEGNKARLSDIQRLEDGKVKNIRVKKKGIKGLALLNMCNPSDRYEPSEALGLSTYDEVRKHLRSRLVGDPDLWVENPNRHEFTGDARFWEYVQPAFQPTAASFPQKTVFQYVDSNKYPQKYIVILRTLETDHGDTSSLQPVEFLSPNKPMTLGCHLSHIWDSYNVTSAIKITELSLSVLDHLFDEHLCPPRTNELCVFVEPLGLLGRSRKILGGTFDFRKRAGRA